MENPVLRTSYQKASALPGGDWPAAGNEEAGAVCMGWGWPPPKGALSALIDLGITDDQIAFYFRVGVECVKRYCDRFAFHPGNSRTAKPNALSKPQTADRRTKNRGA
ncbi:MAG: hypothetical protein KGR48_13210 [Alphaproteobacteria bacterium]|nr:hypothetical protein [Alphaproteobacteria bacterium]MBU6471900.1 hypothetical protein [Alphaproteobacteria bacterium]MDE2012026.1 hypothetical protein [Alphaproteobacteria bacterium]MDE2073854.1 hypothetical protein [Alphaproteobacteria bacterium]MDE2351942.1 hypothetical protein [Alphaproteobacteria bacterium]